MVAAIKNSKRACIRRRAFGFLVKMRKAIIGVKTWETLMILEVLIGIAIAIAIIAGAVFFAFYTSNIKGPSRHGIRGNGDSAYGDGRSNRGFDSGGDGGGGGGE